MRWEKTDQIDVLLTLDQVIAGRRFRGIWDRSAAGRGLRQLSWRRQKLVRLRTVLGYPPHFLEMSQDLRGK